MPREQQCTPGVTSGRLAKARRFCDVAELVLDIGGDDGEIGAVVTTLFVHSGIASADVICCLTLGRYSTSADHADAIRLLRTVDDQAAAWLQRLLDLKSTAGYSPKAISTADVRKADRSAQQLLARANDLAGQKGLT